MNRHQVAQACSLPISRRSQPSAKQNHSYAQAPPFLNPNPYVSRIGLVKPDGSDLLIFQTSMRDTLKTVSLNVNIRQSREESLNHKELSSGYSLIIPICSKRRRYEVIRLLHRSGASWNLVTNKRRTRFWQASTGMTRRKEHIFTFYAITLNPNLRATSTTLEVRLTSKEGNRFLDGGKILKLQKN